MARNPLTPFRSGGLLGGGLDDIFSLHRDVNRLFDQMLVGSPMQGGAARSSILNAQMNVSETDGEIRIAAELPGVTEEDIDVSLDDDVLTIRGEKKFEKTDERENFHFVERSYGTFQRSVRLPFPVDPEQVRASFANGVLTVTMPKTEAAARTRRIQVQRGGGQQALGQQGDQSASQSGSQDGAEASGRPQDGAGAQGSGPQA